MQKVIFAPRSSFTMGALEGECRVTSGETIEGVFSRLRPFCMELLDLTRNPRKNSSFLAEMANLLQRAPSAGLQPCLEYTLFPLLLLLDAAVQCRSRKKGDSSDSFGASESPWGGQVVSDSVAEGVLRCIEELLRKCHLGSVNQMVFVLKKLTSGALLSPSEASEEFREGVIRCLKSMLLRLKPCSVGSCSCKEISSFSMSVNNLEDCSPTQSCYEETEECLLTFLRSKDASAAIGHWLSLLLQAAEIEAARGHRGSASLRKEAFHTLRLFVAKVGTADQLAFFLPGIVSRFTKALLLSKNMLSSAAGNAGSIEHAVRGLTEFLIVVLRDEENLTALQISTNGFSSADLDESRSVQTVLDALRHLPANNHALVDNSICQSAQLDSKDKNNDIKQLSYAGIGSLHVQRTKEWVDQTSARVDKLLSATFPHLCIHHAEIVRKALVDGIIGLLSHCSYTLQNSKLKLLECLFTLVCDDADTVSSAAQNSLNFVFSAGKRILRESDISELFSCFLERLPKEVLGSGEIVAVSHARRLLALMYYAGPELVVDHIFSSPMKAARFLDYLMLSLGHDAQFAGSINRLVSSDSLSAGYLLSIANLKACSLSSDANHGIDSDSLPLVTEVSWSTSRNMCDDYEFPHMPPWFINIGSQKLYISLARILRLAGLSIMAGNRSHISLMVFIDNLLDHIRKLIYEVRVKGFEKEGWQSWYSRGGSGQLLRTTSASVCMINEIIYGLSDDSIGNFLKLYKCETVPMESSSYNDQPNTSQHRSFWNVHQGKEAQEHIIDCIGSILHEYTSSEVWDLPVDQNSNQLENTESNTSLYFFRDVRMLHQVVIEGIGIFSTVLREDFMRSGFMHSTLYLLLKNLICSNDSIRRASDVALHVLSTSTGHSSVGHLVVANADYIIDSLCRQLRHLDVNPHVPDVLAAMLSYIGAAQEIFPLLEEPMRAVSCELEVIARSQHPHLTVPFLKAVNEISKASGFESFRLPNAAKSFNAHVMLNISSSQAMGKNNVTNTQENQGNTDIKLRLEQLEELLFKLNEMRRYRRTVGSLATSCLKVAVPLICSQEEAACLIALSIAEDCSKSLAKVEEAFKFEKDTKAAIERAIHMCSFSDLEDMMEAEDDEVDENRLLPAVNKMWPYLLLCLENKVSVAAIKRCAVVISEVVQVAGGDFFVRRFHTGGAVIWKLLSRSPFHKAPLSSNKRDNKLLLLPYRSTSLTWEDPMAEASCLKIQIAVLNMIAGIASNKRSAAALQTVFKKVSGLVVGIACSGVASLRDPSMKALVGLARMNPDPIWLLLADVYYSLKENDVPSPPSPEFDTIPQLLPPPLSSKEYLYVQYGGETFGFDADPSSVKIAFQKLNSEVLS